MLASQRFFQNPSSVHAHEYDAGSFKVRAGGVFNELGVPDHALNRGASLELQRGIRVFGE